MFRRCSSSGAPGGDGLAVLALQFHLDIFEFISAVEQLPESMKIGRGSKDVPLKVSFEQFMDLLVPQNPLQRRICPQESSVDRGAKDAVRSVFNH